MDPNSMEDLFFMPGDKASRDARLCLYHLLNELAARDPRGEADHPSLSYQGAKRLSLRLGINTPERLENLFESTGLGGLTLEINSNRLRAVLSPGRDFDFLSSLNATGPCGDLADGGYNLEHGLIDGALELISGSRVKTAEVGCRTNGDGNATFEAVREGDSDFIPSVSAPEEADSGSSGQARAGCEVFVPEMRSWFMDLTSRELARMRRHGRQLSLLYVDLDDLRQINQEHGRPAGDKVISAAAAAIRSNCRTEDFFWHEGEDEFAIIMSETGARAAEAVASRLAAKIGSAGYDVPVTISASIGFSTYPDHAEDVRGLFATARAAMYLVKSKGKEIARATGEIAEVNSQTVPNKDFASETVEVSSPVGRQAVTVLIASASPLLITGMRQVLMEGERFETVDATTNAGHLPVAVGDLRPDVVFLDWQMAAANDFAVMRLIKAKNLPCKIVVLATDIDEKVVGLASEFPVDGIILQDSSAEEILTGLDKIYHGQTVMPTEVRFALANLKSKKKVLAELSEREAEVLRLVAEGKSNSQIASELYISVNTVRFHLANIYSKLHVSNRTEAANYFLRRNPGAGGQTKLL